MRQFLAIPVILACLAQTLAAVSAIARGNCLELQEVDGYIECVPEPPRCGIDHHSVSCSNNVCCSQAGYCGLGPDYCSVPGNCQPQFGWCDNKVMPKGRQTWDDKRDIDERLSSEELITQCPNGKSVAVLTFDDGPGKFTHELLSFLRHERVSATFFVTGISNGMGQLDETPWREDDLWDMYIDNHLIGSHTWSHANLSSLTSHDRKYEMYKNEIVIQNVIGVYPTYFRAPYAECDALCISDMHELGYHVVGTGWDTADWETDFNLDKAKHRFDEMLAKLPKDSNLMISQHDTVAASALDLTKYMVDKLKAQGFHFATVQECILGAHRYRNSNGSTVLGSSPNGVLAVVAFVSAILAMLLLV